MKHILDKSFIYVPAAKHGSVDDFKARMEAYRQRVEAEKAASNVKPLIKVKHGR